MSSWHKLHVFGNIERLGEIPPEAGRPCSLLVSHTPARRPPNLQGWANGPGSYNRSKAHHSAKNCPFVVPVLKKHVAVFYPRSLADCSRLLLSIRSFRHLALCDSLSCDDLRVEYMGFGGAGCCGARAARRAISQLNFDSIGLADG